MHSPFSIIIENGLSHIDRDLIPLLHDKDTLKIVVEQIDDIFENNPKLEDNIVYLAHKIFEFNSVPNDYIYSTCKFIRSHPSIQKYTPHPIKQFAISNYKHSNKKVREYLLLKFIIPNMSPSITEYHNVMMLSLGNSDLVSTIFDNANMIDVRVMYGCVEYLYTYLCETDNSKSISKLIEYLKFPPQYFCELVEKVYSLDSIKMKELVYEYLMISLNQDPKYFQTFSKYQIENLAELKFVVDPRNTKVKIDKKYIVEYSYFVDVYMMRQLIEGGEFDISPDEQTYYLNLLTFDYTRVHYDTLLLDPNTIDIIEMSLLALNMGGAIIKTVNRPPLNVLMTLAKRPPYEIACMSRNNILNVKMSKRYFIFV